MTLKTYFIILLFLLSFQKTAAQTTDSIKNLKEVIVKGFKTVNGLGHMLDNKNGIKCYSKAKRP